MKIVIIGAVGCLLTLITGCSAASPGREQSFANATPTPAEIQNAYDDPKQAALSGLSTLQKLLETSQDYSGMGFESSDQLSRATLGEPASLFGVGIDQLAKYKPDSDPQSIVTNTNRLAYPVIVDERGCVLITIEQKEGKWRFVSFGDQEVAKNLVRVRGHKSAGPGGAALSAYFIVRVNALFLTFLGNIKKGPGDSAGSLILVPLNGKEELKAGPGFRGNEHFLMVNPNFNAEREGSKKANDVFGSLSMEAKTIDRSKPL